MYLAVCDLFFFFKQKTAYEMRISDWSSDVCSSDLPRRKGLHAQSERAAAQRARRYADQRCQGRKEGAQIAPLHRPYGDGPRFAISARIIARSDCADARSDLVAIRPLLAS